ncbi:MAG: hypothetical protein JW867_07635 [Candidatus Omnitrophica bacterium]|nr:hypothetical protein [Candidatus Omnitrophota bacterium]
MKLQINTLKKYSLLILLVFISCSQENPSQDKKNAAEVVRFDQEEETAKTVPSTVADEPKIEMVDLRNPEYAGEFFGIKVPTGNYYFAKRAILTYSASWRGNPQTESELEDLVWQELLLSYEVFRRGIEPTEEDIDVEIEKTLKAQKVDFDWKEDEQAFEKWLDENLKVAPDVFRNQIRHLVSIQKLKDQIIESIEPEVTEEEAYQKFLDEYNTLSVELIRIDDLQEAQDFYKQVIKPIKENDWDELAYHDLVFSYEAEKRVIEVSDDDLAEVLIRFLREHNVRFKKEDYKKAFEEWSKENDIEITLFYKRMLSFAKLEKLMQQIRSGEQQPIDEDKYDSFFKKNSTPLKAYQNFFKEFNVDKEKVLGFAGLKEAKIFYKKIGRRPGAWDDRKRREPESFKRPGFVALDFLIHMWGFQRKDAYAMLDYAIGSYYEPAPIYKGYGVFKILEIRKAEDSQYTERNNYYLDKVKMIKKHEGFKKWLDNLKEEAKIKPYVTQ